MVFSSILFLFLFLPVTLAIYYIAVQLCPRWSNTILVVASVMFYVWGAPKSIFLGLFLASILLDFIVARFIAKLPSHSVQAKWLVAVAVGANLAFLMYYKYANFFVSEISGLLTKLGMSSILWTNVLLPIGISFFVFHKISYIVDVFKRKARPLDSIADFTMYLLLFPQLIAGPIVRFHEIESQIHTRQHTVDLFFQGIWRFALGMAKKVLIANTLGSVVDEIYKSSPQELSISVAWIGAVLYAFQIYFDFSGYSDMAIGLGNMFGFKLPENFNRPYVAQSITDFWRRWHMSLSRFFRDYLYIPLGGNRCSTARNYFNLSLVFFLCGLWHGASWVFVAWGGYHGLLLMMDKLFLLKMLHRIPAVFSQALTFLLVVIGWVFFRSDSIATAFSYLQSMFGMVQPGVVSSLSTLLSNKTLFYACVAAVFSFIDFSKMELSDKLGQVSLAKGFAALFLVIYCSVVLSTGSFNPFIYFQF